MKTLITISFFLISPGLFSQRPNKADSLGYETITYLERIDSSSLPQAKKNALEYEKIKNYIQRRPTDGYGTQLLRFNKYFDTTKLSNLYALFDTALQRQISQGFKYTKIRSAVIPGNPFPAMTLLDTLHQKLTISQLKGKIVFIDIWASWCVPCRQEMPALRKLYEKYKEKGFVVIAISLDEHKDKWLKAVQQDSLPWKHFSELTDWDNNSLLQTWGIDAVPYNFLIDKKGVLVDKLMSIASLEKVMTTLQ